MKGYSIKGFVVLAIVAAAILLFGDRCSGQQFAPDFYDETIKSGGSWGYFHAVGASVITATLYQAGNKHSVTIVVGFALAWEVIEYIVEDVEKIYGSRSAFMANAVGDITLALSSAIITYIVLNVVERIRR